MSEDIPYTGSLSLNIPDLDVDDSELEDYVMYELEGKTFLWKTIIYALRSEGMIVLAAASSGIDSLLFPVGRTAHSYESPMNDRRCFETLDRTLRDLFDEPNHLYGGKTVMLGEDFRQTLPVKKSATRDEIIRSSVAKSYICRHFKMHYLTENMRLNNQGLHEVDRKRVSVFAHWLLDVGNRHIGTPDESDPENTSNMATTSDRTREDKGKMIVAEPEITNIADLRSIHCNKTIEATVYRKWTSKHVQTRQPTKYCWYSYSSKHGCQRCRLLQLHKAYRISGFSCEQTRPWEQTLENSTSLIFGRYIDLQEIPNDGFPEHYFNFASYNELPARADGFAPIKIDYVDRIQAVGRIYTSGDVMTIRTRRRIIDIQNLSGKAIGLTLWHEMAINFNVQEYESIEKPVVIAISSCWALISDGSATIYVTCFSDQANSLTRDCNELLAERTDKDPYQLPSSLKDLEGTTHTFQFHFDAGSTLKKRDFVLDRVFKNTILPLPAPPPQRLTSTTISGEQLEQIQPPKPLSPALSTTASNLPGIVEGNTGESQEPQSTPPHNPKPTKTQKEDERVTYHDHLLGRHSSKVTQKPKPLSSQRKRNMTTEQPTSNFILCIYSKT
ncbi:DNA helicase [Tanacetum coccineum]